MASDEGVENGSSAADDEEGGGCPASCVHCGKPCTKVPNHMSVAHICPVHGGYGP